MTFFCIEIVLLHTCTALYDTVKDPYYICGIILSSLVDKSVLEVIALVKYVKIPVLLCRELPGGGGG